MCSAFSAGENTFGANWAR